jgi:cysteine desulfurase
MYPVVLAVMTRHLAAAGNPSSLHSSGRHARRVVEESRETIAAALNSRPSEVVFTSGGTESDNLAVKGIYSARLEGDARRTRVLTTAVEHPAVLEAVHWLGQRQGASVELLPVNRHGELCVATLAASIERDPASVALVSVMWANHEVGTLQPIPEVVRIAHAHGIPVHSDAVGAVGQVVVDFKRSGVDALTFTGHKLGGPQGVGALLVRSDLTLNGALHGGGQERGIRSGTPSVAAVAGLAAAVEVAVRQQPGHAARVALLRDALVRRTRSKLPDVTLNGLPCTSDRRLPGNANLHLPRCEGDSLVMLLDACGIEVSTGSACSNGVPGPSRILLAMGATEVEARCVLRVTLGHISTPAEVDAFVDAIGPIVERARARPINVGDPVQVQQGVSG